MACENLNKNIFTYLFEIILVIFVKYSTPISAIIATNLRAAFQITQLAVPYLIASKGNIVNVSSVCGMLAFENFLPYCISKSGLDQFTKCVAMEVRLNDIDFHDS